MTRCHQHPRSPGWGKSNHSLLTEPRELGPWGEPLGGPCGQNGESGRRKEHHLGVTGHVTHYHEHILSPPWSAGKWANEIHCSPLKR